MADIVIGIASSHTPQLSSGVDMWHDHAERDRRCQRAVDALAAALRAAAPDVALVIGDDQRELFIDDGIPTFVCFTGRSLIDAPPDAETRARFPRGVRAAYGAVHSNRPVIHPVDPGLSAHIAEQLAWDDFDFTVCRDELRSGNSEILNWIAAAGALEGLTPTVLDYVPGYCTTAGTGAGMAFAQWS